MEYVEQQWASGGLGLSQRALWLSSLVRCACLALVFGHVLVCEPCRRPWTMPMARLAFSIRCALFVPNLGLSTPYAAYPGG